MHCLPGDFPDTAADVEVASVDSGIHLGDFLDIAAVAGCAVLRLLGQSHAACMFPIERAFMYCQVPCRGLYREYGVRRGAGRILIVDAASTAEG